jgi:hypothetical protein
VLTTLAGSLTAFLISISPNPVDADARESERSV